MKFSSLDIKRCIDFHPGIVNLMSRMSKLSFCLMSCFSCLSALPLHAQSIAPYLGGREAALSFTFDDGFRHQVHNACEVIEAFGFRGTFFLIPEVMSGPARRENTLSWEEANVLRTKGHELGTHGLVRHKLHEADAEILDQQINGGWKAIKEHTGRAPVSYARPGGSHYTDNVVATIREHHLFIRGEAFHPGMVVSAYGSQGKRVWTDEKTREKIRTVINGGGWFVPVIHAIVEGYSPFKSKEEFRTHCAWIQSQEDRLWVAPMGEVGRYVMQRDHTELKILEENRHSLKFRLLTRLENPDVFDSPLTVRFPSKGKPQPSAVRANGEQLPVNTREDLLLIDVPADAGEVTLTWK